jgi:hypothetical protein
MPPGVAAGAQAEVVVWAEVPAAQAAEWEAVPGLVVVWAVAPEAPVEGAWVAV